MALAGFAARRRAARSSRPFRLILSACLLFCFVVAWYGSSDGATSRYSRSRGQQDLDAGTMGQHRLHASDDDAGSTQEPLKLHFNKNRHSLPLRIITYNIRYATTNPVPGEWPWEVRLPKLITQLKFITAGHESPFICLQEALYHQVTEIQDRLGTSWSHIGRGRADDAKDGEFSPVFYRSDVWACDRSETRWLSETPKVPSRGWDAALNRVVTMGEFSHKVTGTKVVVMSTHFDHIGVQARQHSAELLIKFAEEWSKKSGHSSSSSSKSKPSVVLVGGDFNSTPDDGAYKTMVAEGSGMSDIADLVPAKDRYGYHVTYTSFGEPEWAPTRIDFLFIKKPHTAVVNTFGVLPNSFDDQIRISDHRPVVSDMDIAP